ncbi:MAG: hypothetical protein EBT06_09090 [Gammaproteobacteria bacterium]|nr:hypothetical protein [Gammaproteobacteria bacterium]NBT45062.1 hypothetical protein [Gammaproteobacteria bacterium]NBY22686.1 hypothetical protein [Gammaproteobacteria bacterium]NDE34071.1 hypothetical protein [Gammaproteobacteria bacterium]NDE56036.1 hypothetical protein [Gammaproteobacteria bacterium]
MPQRSSDFKIVGAFTIRNQHLLNNQGTRPIRLITPWVDLTFSLKALHEAKGGQNHETKKDPPKRVFFHRFRDQAINCLP